MGEGETTVDSGSSSGSGSGGLGMGWCTGLFVEARKCTHGRRHAHRPTDDSVHNTWSTTAAAALALLSARDTIAALPTVVAGCR